MRGRERLEDLKNSLRLQDSKSSVRIYLEAMNIYSQERLSVLIISSKQLISEADRKLAPVVESPGTTD
jgi:hypothetical protein